MPHPRQWCLQWRMPNSWVQCMHWVVMSSGSHTGAQVKSEQLTSAEFCMPLATRDQQTNKQIILSALITQIQSQYTSRGVLCSQHIFRRRLRRDSLSCAKHCNWHLETPPTGCVSILAMSSITRYNVPTIVWLLIERINQTRPVFPLQQLPICWTSFLQRLHITEQ